MEFGKNNNKLVWSKWYKKVDFKKNYLKNLLILNDGEKHRVVNLNN